MKYALLLILAACDGVFGLDPLRLRDGGPADLAIPDIATGWSTPQVVTLPVPAGGEFATDLSLSEDEQIAAYSVVVNGDGNLYEARMRSRTTGTATTSIETDATKFHGSPELSPDGLTIHAQWAESETNGELVRWTRTSTDAAWTGPVPVEELTTTADERPGPTDRTNQRMVIVRAAQLAEVVLQDGRWTPIATTGALTVAAAPRNPYLSADGLTLLFVATEPSSGLSDVFVSSRYAVDMPWLPAQRLDVASSPVHNEQDPWLSADGKRIYFSREEAILFIERP